MNQGRHPAPRLFPLGIILVFLIGLLIIGSNGCEPQNFNPPEKMIQVGGAHPPPDFPIIPPETLMTTYSDSRYGFTIQHPFDCWMVQKGNTYRFGRLRFSLFQYSRDRDGKIPGGLVFFPDE